MNTMPQAFDARPLHRSALPMPAARAPRSRASDASLKLVVDRTEAAGLLGAEESPLAVAGATYGLNGRRHLASVPQRVPQAQAATGSADNAGMAGSWTPRRLEPLAFALVLLVSVAALAVALRAG